MTPSGRRGWQRPADCSQGKRPAVSTRENWITRAGRTVKEIERITEIRIQIRTKTLIRADLRIKTRINRVGDKRRKPGGADPEEDEVEVEVGTEEIDRTDPIARRPPALRPRIRCHQGIATFPKTLLPRKAPTLN